MSDDLCNLCEEPLPQIALHKSNEIAIKHGYCSWICLSMDLGHEKALAIVKQIRIEKEGQHH